MKNFHKTLIFTFLLSLVSVIFFISIQTDGQDGLNGCSYLDPIIIDVFAFSASIFLIMEGLIRIYEHENASIKRQFTRVIRIAAGFSILSLHIMQFMYK